MLTKNNNSKFMKFDNENFYPSISEDLLERALKCACRFTTIPTATIDIIKHCRKSLLFSQNNAWVKKDNPEFDVTMGSYDGAEICELVGLYLLEELTNIIPKELVSLYRNDGLAILPNTSGPETERLKKNIRKLFKDNKLKITIEAGMHQTDFLDVTFNASTGKYWPFRKPNSILQYIHNQSNHPPNIRKQLPTMIEKRLSSIAYDENEFNKAALAYNQALEKSGFKHSLVFQATKTEKPRNRKRNIT